MAIKLKFCVYGHIVCCHHFLFIYIKGGANGTCYKNGMDEEKFRNKEENRGWWTEIFYVMERWWRGRVNLFKLYGLRHWSWLNEFLGSFCQIYICCNIENSKIICYKFVSCVFQNCYCAKTWPKMTKRICLSFCFM